MQMMVVRVGQVRRVVCASLVYLAAHGVPKVPQDLLEHRVISIAGVSP